MEIKDKFKQLERRIEVLEREKRIINDKLMNQAHLILSIGKKVMKMDAIIKEDNNSKKKVEPVETQTW